MRTRILPALLLAVLAVGACGADAEQEQSELDAAAERAGRTLEEAVDEVGAAAEQAGEEIEDVAGDAASEVSDAVTGNDDGEAPDTLRR